MSIEIGEIVIASADERGEVVEEDKVCYIVSEAAHNGLTPIIGIWKRVNGKRDTDKLIGRFYPDDVIQACRIIKIAGDDR